MPEQAGTLMQRTFELLQEANEPLLKMSQNADVSFYWLQKFKAGTVEDPSVNAVQKLYEYLSGKSLKL